MKKYLWQIRILAVFLALSTFSPWAYAAGANWHFTQQADETLIPLDQIGPRQITGEYDLPGGHKLSLGITADKKYIDLTPRASVRLKVELLDNGHRVTDLGTLGDPKKSIALKTLIAKPQIQVNITKLDGHIGRPLPNITISEPGLTNNLNMRYQGGYCPAGYQSYWSPLYLGKDRIGEIRNQLVGAGFAGTRAAFDQTMDEPSYALFDLKKGEADFEYIYGGVRTMPFVEFAVGITAGFEGRLQSQISLPFADQIGKKSIPKIEDKGTGDVGYKVGFSKSALNAKSEQKFTVNVQATRKGAPYASPYQRIRITALPVAKAGQVAKAGAGGPSTSKTQYSPLAPDKAFSQVDMAITNPGEFVMDDEINYRRAGLLYTGPYTTNADCITPASIELDLIDGKAGIDYIYKGSPGLNRQLTFVVQPIDYFVAYDGWPLKTQVNLDDPFRNKNYDWIDKRRTNPTYREEKNLVYPLDKLPFQIEDGRAECVGGIGIKNSGCALPTIALYGDTWMPANNVGYKTELDNQLWGENAINLAQFSQTNYAIASLPVGHSGFNFWLWVLIGHIIKIAILAIRLIWLKKHTAHVSGQTS